MKFLLIVFIAFLYICSTCVQGKVVHAIYRTYKLLPPPRYNPRQFVPRGPYRTYDRKKRYRSFLTNATVVASNWEATGITLFFSRKPGKNCTAVPAFHKAGYRRLYLGEIYNVTGYHFYNAYTFTDYCATQEGECLGKVEIQEYVDHKGDYFYDTRGSYTKNMDSGLSQMFSIANIKR
ncbi:unnamed protein product [Cylicocyclus nassatus]|uniref:Uncharacterized protein n=1 Tax=Cylicocyclus nassatus TaxID=53992 RepID=A0AA36M8J2_CYLNA|nr:unnamed protein product [Cylicocyclus nassatus]